MEPTAEIQRLLDLMPASGRMMTKIISKPQQPKVIDVPFPMPWNRERRIFINFDLWRQLTKPQRDLILLRSVSWVIAIRWFKPDLYQGLAAAGALASCQELLQADAIGASVASLLTALAIRQLWRSYRSSQAEIAADEAALRVACRRGYSETEAAKHLLTAIEALAQIEKRGNLNFIELIRVQNLKAIAGLSPVGVPDSIKQE
ncbi:MAG: DUF3318 domain-containing protein [Oscillatoriaceae bacterium SKW80]|nr:DUF3318 domain-containing protein [Oscillatoriaceae bacterium SKYG93]MCX8121567.1 DUF3318 domain-containing protein [Oscillatoriaceae bacterium SKW80]MDW8452846.1 DUF3318 domain-containing protein [Oscillatoriaceae cyanobacterium SKYGB_i_bin93]HIK27912.1 DUF3318 domain-containing protein [Oscillatoriaceae cyanobacterium M7585_C2015_266]